jgi:flagellar basal body-associated protein FliL
MADKKEPDKKNPIPEKKGPPAKIVEPPKIVVKAKALLASVAQISKSIIQSPTIQNPKNLIRDFGLLGWMKVFTCVAVALLTYAVYKTAPQWKKLWGLPYQSSLETVADHKFTHGSKIVQYSNDLLSPQHFVLVNKIVVNVKPGKLSNSNPMVAFDLYVRTDTEAAAVEIKDREKQIQDHLQRFCEGLPYDEIQSEEGKLTWKNRMKRELNLILNTGRVKEVFFKTLLIKP